MTYRFCRTNIVLLSGTRFFLRFFPLLVFTSSVSDFADTFS